MQMIPGLDRADDGKGSKGKGKGGIMSTSVSELRDDQKPEPILQLEQLRDKAKFEVDYAIDQFEKATGQRLKFEEIILRTLGENALREYREKLSEQGPE